MQIEKSRNTTIRTGSRIRREFLLCEKKKKCSWPWKKSNQNGKFNHLITFLANIDPGGAVGGRFIRIFVASGTSDARLIFTDDKSMAFGSFDSATSSSWNDTKYFERKEKFFWYLPDIFELKLIARTRFANFSQWWTTAFCARCVNFDGMLFLFGITSAWAQ